MTTITATRQNKIAALLACFDALQRGVQEPTIVLNEDGTLEYVPGAYLTDVSYTDSRAVVTQIEGAAFGPTFNLVTATEEELQGAAAWAADEWDWMTEEDDDE